MNKKTRQEKLNKIIKEAEIAKIIAIASEKADENNVEEGNNVEDDTYADKFLDSIIDSIIDKIN